MKLLTKQTIIIALILIGIMALIAIAQSPVFRPAQGIPAVVEEIRITTLELARQQHGEIAAQIASETASDATHVFTSDGYIAETIWLPEAQAAMDYWTARITILETP